MHFKDEKLQEILRSQGFYYTPPTIAGTYTDDATGELHPEQIPVNNKWYLTQKINDDTYFDEENKMTLIITDPTHSLLPSYNLDEYQNAERKLWDKLFTEGFDIYVWTASGPRKCSTSDDVLDLMKLVEPQPKADVKRNAKISSPDRTLVLDLMAIRQLMIQLHADSVLSLSPSVINVSLLNPTRLSFYTSMSKQELLRAMPGINPSDFPNIEISPSNYNDHQTKLHQSRILDLFIQNSKLKSFVISSGSEGRQKEPSDSTQQILSDIVKYVKMRDGEKPGNIFLTLQDIYITEEVVDIIRGAPYIKVIDVDIILGYGLHRLFNLEHVQTMSINSSSLSSSLSVPDGAKFNRLKSLDLANQNLTVSCVKNILTTSPNIEELSIQHVILTDIDDYKPASIFFDEDIIFRHIHFFRWTGYAFFQGIAELISKMPNLISLHLGSSNEIKNIDDELRVISQNKISHNIVAFLMLKNFEMSEERFYEFLNLFPNLQQLVLQHCNIVQNKKTDHKVVLNDNRVTSIKFNNVRLREECFSNLMSQCSTFLVTLALEDCQIYDFRKIQDHAYQVDLFDHLKVVNICNNRNLTPFNMGIVLRIWQSASVLEGLTVVDLSSRVTQELWFQPSRLREQPHMRDLSLKGGRCEELIPLLGYAPNLEKLELAHLRNLCAQMTTVKSSVANLTLKKLYDLSIHSCDINQILLTTLSSAAPNITRLSLSYCAQSKESKLSFINRDKRKQGTVGNNIGLNPLLQKLRTVIISGNNNFSITILQDLLQSPDLMLLTLADSGEIDLSDLESNVQILESSKADQLRELNISGTKISLNALILLVKRFEKLSAIAFSKNEKLSQEDAEIFTQHVKDSHRELRLDEHYFLGSNITTKRNKKNKSKKWSISGVLGKISKAMTGHGNRNLKNNEQLTTALFTPEEQLNKSEHVEVVLDIPDGISKGAAAIVNYPKSAMLPPVPTEVNAERKVVEKPLTKNDLSNLVKNINQYEGDTFDEKRLKKMANKLTPAKIDLARENEKGREIPDINIDSKNVKETLGWIKRNYKAILDELEEPLTEFRRDYGHLSTDDLIDIFLEIDNSVMVRMANEGLSMLDLDAEGAELWINEKFLSILTTLLPDIAILLKASLRAEKQNVKRALLEITVKLTVLNIPTDVQKHIIKLLNSAIEYVVEVLPKLHALIKDEEALQSPYSLLKIIKVVSILRILVSYRSLIKATGALSLPDDTLEEEVTTTVKVVGSENGSAIQVDQKFIELAVDDTLKAANKKQLQFSFRPWETLNTDKCTHFDQFWLQVSQMLEKKQPKTPNAIVYLPGDNIASFNIEMMRCLSQSGNAHYFLNNIDDTNLTTLAVHQGVPKKTNTEFGVFCEEANAGDVLVINISKHRRGLNSVTDTDTRQFLNKKIPDGVKVILLVDSNLGIQLDGDIYGRCSVRTHYKLQPSSDLDNIVVEKILTNKFAVNLYHDARGWEQPLLGNFLLEGKQINFLNGLIAEAIAQNQKEIHIINAPMQSTEFLHWLNAVAVKKKVFFNGSWHALSVDFKIHLYEKSYELYTQQCSFVLFNKNLHGDYDFVLNPATFHNFFKNHEERNKKLFETPGWLKTNNSLHIFINGEITRDQWAKLIDEILLQKTVVKFSVLKKEYCPQEYIDKLIVMKVPVEVSKPEALPTTRSLSRVDFIQSDNIDACVEYLTKTSGLHVDFDHPLTEEDTYDSLFSYLHTQEEGVDYQVKMRKGVDWKALQAEKTVVLHGSMSATLRAKLSLLFSDKPRLLINGEVCYLKGRLIIVTDLKKDAWFVKNCYVYKSSLSGLTPPMTVNAQAEKNISKVRFDAVNGLFAHYPWVKVLGEFGVGKSYFAFNEFKTIADKLYKEPMSVFIGKENIQAYGECKTSGRKLIVVDEYDLEQDGCWDMFKGLRSTISPGFIHNRVFYPTRPKTKDGYLDLVLFMANPKAKRYEGRHRHQFIESLVPTVMFNNFPKTFLIEDIIQPILKEALSDHPCYLEAEKNAITLCEIYQQIKALASPDKAISARNLTMLTVRFAVYCKRTSVKEALANATLEEALYLLEDDNAIEELFADLSNRFSLDQPKGDILEKMVEDVIERMAKNNYFLTQSRRPILKQLLSMLLIREQTILNPALDAHLIRGILIEGETRIGKSALLKNLLVALDFQDGFKEGVPLDQQPAKHNTYYHITANSNIRMMDRVATDVRDGGAIAILDEINTVPVESTLGSTMTGVDKKGIKAKQPGGRTWATQNPASSYSGRLPLSDSLKNRFIILTMPEFPVRESREVVEKIGAGEYSDAMMDAYVRDYQYAKKHGLFPLPSPDDLFRTAAEVKRMIMNNSGEEYFYEDEEVVAHPEPNTKVKDQEEVIVEPRARTNIDIIKENIIKLEKEYLTLKPATWFETFRHPINTFKNWLERRRRNREIHDMKHVWLQAKTQSIVDSQIQPKAKEANYTEISTKTASQFTTRYLMKKFQDLPQTPSKGQVRKIASELEKEKKLFNSQINVKGESGKINRKLSKLQLWGDTRTRLKDVQSNKEILAYCVAKCELLEAEVGLYK